MNATEKFLKYVTIDTRSEEGQEPVPSTNVQFDQANLLVEAQKDRGISDARVDGHCYVYGTIPATTDKAVPTLGFVAHMDTAPVVLSLIHI